MVSQIRWFLFAMALTGTPDAECSNPYTRLSRDLLSDYEPLSLPVKNITDVVVLELSVGLHRIDDMDEKQQIMTVRTYVTQKWRDDYLSWNPEDYAGIREIRMPADKIWLPDTAVLNSAMDSNGLLGTNTNVVISHTGHVLWTFPFHLQSSCNFRIKYIPFDTQVCDVHFSSWSYGTSELQFVNASVHLTHYKNHGEWVLLKAGISPLCTVISRDVDSFQTSEALLTLVLQRRSQFGLLFTIVPFSLIAILSLFVFLVPVDSGEKLSFGITNLLTLIMFYSAVSMTLPSTGTEEFPIIGTFFFVVICLVLTSCLMSVFVLQLQHRKRPPSARIKRLFFGRWGLQCFAWYIPKLGRERRPLERMPCAHNFPRRHLLQSYSSIPSSLSDTPLIRRKSSVDIDTISQALCDLQSHLNRALLGIHRIEGRFRDKNDGEVEAACAVWHKIAVIMDQIFFVILATIFVTVCPTFFLIAVYGDDNLPTEDPF